jgi:hypothetical protein
MVLAKRDKEKKINPKRSWRRLRRRFAVESTRMVRRISHTEEAAREPIDFSAPSIPYYKNLAERFSLARIVLYMLLFVFVVVTLISSRHLITYSNLYYLVKDINAASLTAQIEVDRLSYPASTVGSDFALYRGGLVIASGEEITALSASGKQTLSVSTSRADPRVCASDKYFLTYGLGETSFDVYNSFVRVFGESTEYPIYGACIADNGTFAVVTRSRDYKSEVILYGSDMEKIAGCHIGGYVLSANLNPSGNVLAVVSVEAVDGVYTCKITTLHLSSGVKQSTLELTDTFPASVDFISDTRLAMVCADRLLILDTSGEPAVNAEVSLAEETSSLCAMTTDGGGAVAILSESRTNLSENMLTVYDKNGEIAYTVRIDATRSAVEMCWGGQALYIRTQDTLVRVDAKGKYIRYASIGRDTLAVLPDGNGGLLVCGPAFASGLTSSDFAASIEGEP